jgi:hypothetical protein
VPTDCDELTRIRFIVTGASGVVEVYPATCRLAYLANNFQPAIRRLSRKIRTAITYAAFSPNFKLTLYDMAEASSKLIQKIELLWPEVRLILRRIFVLKIEKMI